VQKQSILARVTVDACKLITSRAIAFILLTLSPRPQIITTQEKIVWSAWTAFVLADVTVSYILTFRVPLLTSYLAWPFFVFATSSNAVRLLFCAPGLAHGMTVLLGAFPMDQKLRQDDDKMARDCMVHPDVQRVFKFDYLVVHRVLRTGLFFSDYQHLVELKVIPKVGYNLAVIVKTWSTPSEKSNYIKIRDNLVYDENDMDVFDGFEEIQEWEEDYDAKLNGLRTMREALGHADTWDEKRLLLLDAVGLAIADVHRTRHMKGRAASRIQAAWRLAVSNPYHPVCQRRLGREFELILGLS
jgi:hypothetical protein